MGAVAALRPGLPGAWAHHDDGNYVGRPYTPYADFHQRLEKMGCGQSGFGIIHWMTRPLDLHFKSLVNQVWQDRRNEPLAVTCRRMAEDCLGPAQAQAVRQAAENSVGMHRGLPAARAAIRLLLAQLEALKPIRKQLEDQIEALAGRLPDYLASLPGASPASIVSLFGETDPIAAFTSPAQLIAFAGLDLVVSQSGEYQAPRRHISKRGSPFLRHTLWAMAHRACYQEGDLRNYWLRRKAQGLSHRESVTAVAVKLCPVVWRIMTDRRNYLPQRPVTKP